MPRDDFDLDLDRQERRRARWAWGVPLLVMACIAWFLAPRQSDESWESPHANLSYEVDQVDWDAVRHAFVAPTLAVNAKEAQRIERMLRRADRPLPADRLDQVVDVDRLTQRVLESGFIRTLSRKEQEALAQSLRSATFVDFSTRSLRLATVEPIGPHEWMVYTRCRTGNRTVLVRWWLTNDGGVWRWFDWHLIGCRRVMSEELAVTWVYREDPLWTGAFTGGPWSRAGGPPLLLIRDHWNQQQRRSAVTKLHEAEARLVHRFVNDSYRVEIARVFAEFRRFADARRLLTQIERPGEVPDYFLIAADCLSADGAFDEAAKRLAAYESRVGATAESAQRRLDVARRSGKLADAMAACEQWQRLAPTATGPWVAAAELCDERSWNRWVLQLIESPSGPRMLARVIASTVAQDRRSGWTNLDWAAECVMPESGWRFLLAARRAEEQGDRFGAAEAMSLALKHADPDTRRWWNEELIRLLIMTRQWERLLEEPTGPAHALFTLLTRTDWDRESFEPGELLALAERYRTAHPDSKWGDILVMEAAYIERDWRTAWDTFQHSGHRGELIRSERARHRAVLAHMAIAGPVAALTEAVRKIEAVEIVGHELISEKRWDDLRAFMKAIRDQPFADDPVALGWMHYFSGELELADGRRDEARQHFLLAIEQANLSDQPDWILNQAVPALVRLSLDEGSWRQVLADPRVGAREWPLWIEELRGRLKADPGARPLFDDFLDAFEEYYDSEPMAAWWRAKLAFDDGDWVGVTDTLWPWPEPTMLTLRPQRESECREMLAMSFAQLGRWEDLGRLSIQAASVGDRRWLGWHALMTRSGTELARVWPTLSDQERVWFWKDPTVQRLVLPLLFAANSTSDAEELPPLRGER